MNIGVIGAPRVTRILSKAAIEKEIPIEKEATYVLWSEFSDFGETVKKFCQNNNLKYKAIPWETDLLTKSINFVKEIDKLVIWWYHNDYDCRDILGHSYLKGKEIKFIELPESTSVVTAKSSVLPASWG